MLIFVVVSDEEKTELKMSTVKLVIKSDQFIFIFVAISKYLFLVVRKNCILHCVM